LCPRGMEIDWEIRKLSHGNAFALGVSYNIIWDIGK